METLPTHIAIIMDGNRRWAKERGLPAVAGHKKAVEEGLETLIEHATKRGIKYLTFWCFSTENWGRNRLEVMAIMELFRWALKHKAPKLAAKGARVKMIGDLTKFDQDIQEGFERLMEETEKNTAITTIFALNYGGRDEIIRAILRMAAKEQDTRNPPKGRAGKIQTISAQMFEEYLDTVGVPDPDLIIRAGGERRLSGFMLWQSEYSELYFTETLMPDFGPEALDKAIDEYQRRERRRGR
jgi:undecaprenyl diphosphate synthase